MGYAKEKQKKEYTWPEAWEKKKRREKKDSPYLKIKDRVMQKGV